jgi:hypothetical protein
MGLLNKLTKDDPSLEASFTKEVKQAAKSTIKFFAIGPVQDQFASNLNVIITSSAGYPNNNSYFGIADSQIKVNLVEAGFKELKTSAVVLPPGKALQATYDLPLALSGVPAYELQLYIKHKTQIEIITFTSHSKPVNRSAARALEDGWKWN